MPPRRWLSASRQLLEQTEGTGTLGRPAPAVNLELGVDMPDVNFDRIYRQVKLIADFPEREESRQVTQDSSLGGTEDLR
jgi:hypothetical protein